MALRLRATVADGRPRADAGAQAVELAGLHEEVQRFAQQQAERRHEWRKDQGLAQGDPPMSGRSARRHGGHMARYLLHHRHEPDECGVVFTSFKGHQSPLRHRPTLASCRTGGHAIWWTVEAGSEDDALQQLPYYVAQRTTITRVSEVQIP
jgi:hypothetical protein